VIAGGCSIATSIVSKQPPPINLSRIRLDWTAFIAVGILAIAGWLAYANSLSAPLILDDWVTIQHNPQIRQVWPLWPAFFPPADTGVGGRPIANLSFVLNYALSGDSLRGYHAINLAIHLLASAILYGIVRRTLQSPRLQGQFGNDAALIAFSAAVLWLLHPVQTQSVTYISQRTELLLGLFYFLTFYGFIRSRESLKPAGWLGFSVVSCFFGAACKEGMVTAPVMLFLYDVFFVAGSLAIVWRQRRWFYLGLASSWVLLAGLMTGLHGRGVGFGLGMSMWSYALTECGAIGRYLALALWPHPLIFDYGTDLGSPGLKVAIGAALVWLMASLVAVGILRKVPLAFLGAWFLVTLAPTSSIVPIPLQPIAENRVYLPLASVMCAVPLLLFAGLGRKGLAGCAVMAVALGVATVQRNRDYRSEISIWADTVAKAPASSRAHNNLGHALLAAGRPAEARSEFEHALQLKPDYAEAHSNLGGALGQLGLDAQAIEHCRLALQFDPKIAGAHYNLGVGLERTGDLAGAVAEFEATLRLNPNFAEAHANLADVFARTGHTKEAIVQGEAALAIVPQLVAARYALGCALWQEKRFAEAAVSFEEVLRAWPDRADIYFNLAMSLHQLGKTAEAISPYETALRLNPNLAIAHTNLALALMQTGRSAEAIPHFEAALLLDPSSAPARENLAKLRGSPPR